MAFWYARGAKEGEYVIGSGDREVIFIYAPDTATAQAWAKCCTEALRERERKAHIQARIDDEGD